VQKKLYPDQEYIHHLLALAAAERLLVKLRLNHDGVGRSLNVDDCCPVRSDTPANLQSAVQIGPWFFRLACGDDAFGVVAPDVLYRRYRIGKPSSEKEASLRHAGLTATNCSLGVQYPVIRLGILLATFFVLASARCLVL